jgi:hypothetical protein
MVVLFLRTYASARIGLPSRCLAVVYTSQYSGLGHCVVNMVLLEDNNMDFHLHDNTKCHTDLDNFYNFRTALKI